MHLNQCSAAEWLARRIRDLEVAGSIPDHAILQFASGKQFTLIFPGPPTCKMGIRYRLFLNLRFARATPYIWVKSGLQMQWSARALVALLCGDTVTLSNEAKFSERD
ncbi:hypothetical protein ElyMa_006080300 [Elysia marginata]|uniref:Arrestin-like N-terminal domain-containing protein n=1 Tax=Elysia marginata TaxID=1093978 RepID=A0AAV4GPV4_9GAST|nr:hypothetical protein ElyMa_006080300 [Elysia marginata]